LEDIAVHLVNDELILIATNLNQDVGGNPQHLTNGKIQLQSEGAEIFNRNLCLEPITEFPSSSMYTDE
jgi:hypothetical protein